MSRPRRWREVAAATAAAFVVALAYVAGRVDGGAAPASAAPTPAQQEQESGPLPRDGATTQTPSDHLPGGPPATEAS